MTRTGRERKSQNTYVPSFEYAATVMLRLLDKDEATAPNAAFNDRVVAEQGAALSADRVSWLQVNLGKRCNQACRHCHVDAGPKRTESMDEETYARLLYVLDKSPSITLIDITGGAPELNPLFRQLVRTANQRGLRVIDRCNLTILSENGQEDLGVFLATHAVEIVASLPCYVENNVDRQRGSGVFTRSIQGLRSLNALGYGDPKTGLILDLVYNPVGAHLPPPQQALEEKYRTELSSQHGISFNRLITITNMPVARFAADLHRNGARQAYETLLMDSFNPRTLGSLMCKSLVSVSWDGRLFDCDFNQMLDLPPKSNGTLWDIESFSALDRRRIVTGGHCFGCTAGAGSSCAGALS